VSYEDKTRLQSQDRWESELEKRLADPMLGQRRVWVDMAREAGSLRFTIRDEGQGFDWQNFQDSAPDALLSSHGRGILIARRLSFDEVAYQGCGNVVVATTLLPAQ